jgi:hypothetical protein
VGAVVDSDPAGHQQLGCGRNVEAYRRELDVMTTALADPSLVLRSELLRACWGRRTGDAG